MHTHKLAFISGNTAYLSRSNALNHLVIRTNLSKNKIRSFDLKFPLNKINGGCCIKGVEDAPECCRENNVLETSYERYQPHCNPLAILPQADNFSDNFFVSRDS